MRPVAAASGAINEEIPMRKPALAAIVLPVLLFSTADVARAQLADSAQKFVQVANGYQVTPNLTYLRANNWDAKLDIYQPVGLTGPNPTLVYFHGGGWTAGSKEISSLTFLPYLEMGWTVVNVEYRLSSISLAPAAVEDARCALRWMYRNARQVQLRPRQGGLDRQLGGRTSGPHDWSTARFCRPGAPVPRRQGAGTSLDGRVESGCHHQLVRHHRRRRTARWSEHENCTPSHGWAA